MDTMIIACVALLLAIFVARHVKKVFKQVSKKISGLFKKKRTSKRPAEDLFS